MATLSFLIREFKRALPPTLFFLVVFHIAMFIRHLDETSYGITSSQSVSATISALILGKLYLLLDERRFTNVFADKPLIYTTLWKTLIYGVLATLATIGEELIPMIHHDGGLTSAWHHYLGETVWARFAANHLILISWILIFTASSELIQRVGTDTVIGLFFGTGAKDSGAGAPARKKRPRA